MIEKRLFKLTNIISEKEHYVIAESVAEARTMLATKLNKTDQYIKDNYLWSKHKVLF